MSTVAEHTVIVSAEQATFIDAQVAQGAYASASDVVSAGLEVLREHEAEIEHWLRTEVAATCDEMKADPSQALSHEEVWASIHELHDARLRQEQQTSAA